MVYAALFSAVPGRLEESVMQLSEVYTQSDLHLDLTPEEMLTVVLPPSHFRRMRG